MDSNNAIIVSNWFLWLASVIMTAVTGAIIFLFHNKADREELIALREEIRSGFADVKADIRELRAPLLKQHDSPRY